MRVKVRLEHILYNAKEKRSEAVSNGGQFSDPHRRDRECTYVAALQSQGEMSA